MNTRHLCLALVWVWFAGTAVAAEPAPAGPSVVRNLLENGDFEAGPAGAASRGKLPPGWRAPFVSLKVCEIVEQARPKSPGKRCLRVATDEKTDMGGLYSKLTPLDPSKPLHVSGWLKGGGMMKIPQGAYFGIGWYDAQKRPIVIKQGTKMNYYYLHSGYKAEKWVFREGVYQPAAQKKETYGGREIPPDAAFFDVRVFSLSYPRTVHFDDFFATQDVPSKSKAK